MLIKVFVTNKVWIMAFTNVGVPSFKLDISDINFTIPFMLDTLDINPKDILVICGAASVINGIRETTADIDVEVLTQSCWDKLSDLELDKDHYPKLNNSPAADILKFGSFDFHWRGKDITLPDIEERVFINGVPIQTLKETLESRLLMDREKDQQEIEIISNILNKE